MNGTIQCPYCQRRFKLVENDKKEYNKDYNEKLRELMECHPIGG